jgi:hypothetical protein
MVRLVEFFLKLQDMLIEREKVTEDLKDERVGLKKVDAEDVIRRRLAR